MYPNSNIKLHSTFQNKLRNASQWRSKTWFLCFCDISGLVMCIFVLYDCDQVLLLSMLVRTPLKKT